MDRELFCKGYTWGFFSREGELFTDNAEQSMRRLASNGLDWICITVNGWQETFFSTTVFSFYGMTQTDAEIEHAVKLAKSLGLKVCLKPMVNCLDRSWRARIDFPTEDGCDYWKKWFSSYNRFMLYYAKMAENLGCEMLCTGCEMAGMDKQSSYCRDMISRVRNVYHGIIMHNINHGDEFRFDWLSEVDVIGISGYYPVTDGENTGIEFMRNRWADVVLRLEKCHEKYSKPIMFAEIGVRSEQGCSAYPWDFHDRPEKPTDEQEQSDFYESAMEATWDKPWFCGYFWWDWKAVIPPEDKAKENRDFTVYGKLAEKTLKKWYTSK
ncbi:glycoside hydrolase family 113 [Ruminococcus albus]|uniref:Glycosyl hydrolase family 53 n=1 Tax=Ruminococcus albus TaxID=1264 RepID=A0A1I1MJE9_RUMAL|nr:hypothetical protein [Ruminococcus albus]SFC85539.1 hypothetical protein SAMN02910406_02502 [Ruminococcus albus]